MPHYRVLQQKLSIRYLFPLLGLGCLFITVLLLWLAAAKEPYVQENFSYTADILTTDNFYDQTNERYAGERYTQAKFYYYLIHNLTHTQDESARIASVLDTVAIGGERAGIITRQQTIRLRDGKSLSSSGVHAAGPEYLFAPRNLKKGQPFTYRHVTYDMPAHMRYAGQETLFGLPVYRYETRYQGTGRIEQTKQVGQKGIAASGVPTTQDIEHQPHLQVWVEPTTGWLVKVVSDTTSYSFDRKSGKRIAPYNRSRAQYTEESVRQHVAYARALTSKQIFARRVGPVLMLLVVLLGAIVLMVRRYSGAAIPIYGTLGAVTLVLSMVWGGWIFRAWPLVTFFGLDVGLNPFSAICFALVTVCLILLYRPYRTNTALLLSGLVVIFAGLQLLGGVNAIPFALDLALFRPALDELGAITPARMSPYSAFAFLLLGIGLFKVSLSRKRSAVRFAVFLAGLVITLGIIGLLIRMLQLEKAYTISLLYSISGQGSALFVLCGLTFLQVLQRIQLQMPTIGTTVRLLLRPALASIPLMFILAVAQLQQNVMEQKLQTAFAEQIASIQNGVTREAYARSNLLASGGALFAASVRVERGEWHNYIGALNLQTVYPDTLGLGYAPALTSMEFASFVRDVRETDAPDFAIFPTGARNGYAPLLYYEPATIQNQKAIGFDLAIDPVRGEAMERARDSGRVSLANKLAPTVLTPYKDDQFLLFFSPVYRTGSVHETTLQRRSALQGYIAGAFDMKHFMHEALRTASTKVDIEIYNGLQASNDELLYDSVNDHQRFGGGGHPRLTRSTVIYAADHPWTIVYKALPEFRLTDYEERMPTMVLLGGAAGYFFLLVTLYPLMASRISRIQPVRKAGGRKRA